MGLLDGLFTPVYSAIDGGIASAGGTVGNAVAGVGTSVSNTGRDIGQAVAGTIGGWGDYATNTGNYIKDATGAVGSRQGTANNPLGLGRDKEMSRQFGMDTGSPYKSREPKAITAPPSSGVPIGAKKQKVLAQRPSSGVAIGANKAKAIAAASKPSGVTAASRGGSAAARGGGTARGASTAPTTSATGRGASTAGRGASTAAGGRGGAKAGTTAGRGASTAAKTVRPLGSPPYTLRSISLSRPFATSPARRKDHPPDDIPEPIPVKENPRVQDQQNEEPRQPPKLNEDSVEAKKTSETSSTGSSAVGSTSNAKGSSGSGSGGESGAGDGGRKGGRKTSNERAIQKPSVPEIYPQVMAIPIAKRPLFPGFYKAVTIRDPNVARAIQEMMRRGQQYVGAFLFKDEASDKDVIDNADEVHDVGVFAQITSAFPVNGEEHSLTAVLYPHRRIKMSRLIPPNETKNKSFSESTKTPPIVEIKPVEDRSKDAASPEKSGDVVASFEESSATPPVRDVQPYEPTAFLRNFAVSLVDVDNLVEESFDRKDPVIKAVTSELVNVFKDVANLNHLFRDQISTFSMSQSAGNILEEPGKLADFAAAVSQGEIRELQDVLETMNVQERLSKALM
ncbi:MAG: hypothetical protein Q9177_005133, partial [Variospora cf. flavescens]